MIIWGSYVMKKVVATGDFHCPNCNTKKGYTLRHPRKWGHLYWIPIIPMEHFDRYVECGACQKAYNEVVLEYDPEKQAREADHDLTMLISQAVALMARARGEHPSVEKIAEHIAAILQINPSLDIVKGMIADSDAAAALQQVAASTHRLTPRGKELVLAAAISSAPLNPEVRARAVELGNALGLSSAHINGILAEIPTG